MTKTQKVKFHKGDRRPNDEQPKLSYTKKMVKRGKDQQRTLLVNAFSKKTPTN